METVEEKLKRLAKEQAEEKHKQYIEAMEKQLADDTEKVNKVLELIEKHTIYFKKDSYTSTYTLVTPELFYEHYMSEGKSQYSYKGINFKETKSFAGRRYSYIEVNGYTYYYFEDMLNKYEEDLEECIRKTQYQVEQLIEMKDKYQELKKQEFAVKKMIEEFAAYQDSLEVDY